jgi:hypothetical protein
LHGVLWGVPRSRPPTFRSGVNERRLPCAICID